MNSQEVHDHNSEHSKNVSANSSESEAKNERRTSGMLHSERSRTVSFEFLCSKILDLSVINFRKHRGLESYIGKTHTG